MIRKIYRGKPFTLDYRVFFAKEVDNGDLQMVSPFHDISLKNPDGSYNFICETSSGTQAKFEISVKARYNPIKIDTKKGRLRYIKYQGGYFFNYGAFPQTWENPDHSSPFLEGIGCGGDNDPLDVCEIGSVVHKTGDVVPVKILGCLAMIDEKETDWKIIAISVNDPLAAQVNDISDVDQNLLNRIREWFRMYKTPTGKKPNKFGMNEEYQNKEFAEKIIEETHNFWEKLISGEYDSGKISLERHQK